MRRLVTLGACSLAGALAMAGCGDDDVVPGGRAGSGGTGGRAGSGGVGGSTAGTGMGGNSGSTAGAPVGGNAGQGTSGNAGNAGNATGGNAGDPGDGGVVQPCTGPLANVTGGCVELSVPVEIVVSDAAPPEAVTSLFQFQDLDVDFSNAVITFRIRALTLNDNFFIQFFSQDTTGFSFDSTGGFHNLNAGGGFANADDFVDLVYDLSAVAPAPIIGVGDAGIADPTAFDKSSIRQFGVQVGANENFVGSETVTVLIDSITIEGDGGEFDDVEFIVDEEGFVLNTGAGSQEGEVIHHP